ncbi:MAG: glucose-1-phosphate thymidylyltransferase RfbA [Pseudobdellovibrionaceae bacterium]
MTKERKGIILAGGAGTRLHPATLVISKQLLPVFDKPMVYYPLSTLMLAGIRDILLISTPRDLPSFQNLLGDGGQWGLSISYAQQEAPNGIAQALTIAESFLDGAPSALVLGDNIFYGSYFHQLLRRVNENLDPGATIFAYRVKDPTRFGVVEFDEHFKAMSLEEKPMHPKSGYAVPGLYFYDSNAVDMVKHQKPSARGELEITDLNRTYLEKGMLKVEVIGRGHAWFDTGTHESLLKASEFVAVVEEQQGLKIACPEEIALRQQWISIENFQKIANDMGKSSYRDYLLSLLQSDFK